MRVCSAFVWLLKDVRSVRSDYVCDDLYNFVKRYQLGGICTHKKPQTFRLLHLTLFSQFRVWCECKLCLFILFRYLFCYLCARAMKPEMLEMICLVNILEINL